MLRSQLFRYSNSHIGIQFKLEIFVTYNKNYFTYSCIDYFLIKNSFINVGIIFTLYLLLSYLIEIEIKIN